MRLLQLAFERVVWQVAEKAVGVSMPAHHHALLRELANLIPGAKTGALTDEVSRDEKQRAQAALFEQGQGEFGITGVAVVEGE
jgi:hypothetical protein